MTASLIERAHASPSPAYVADVRAVHAGLGDAVDARLTRGEPLDAAREWLAGLIDAALIAATVEAADDRQLALEL